MEVWTGGTDRQAPDPVGPIVVHTGGLPAGEALCTWDTPEDHGGGKTLGFHAAYEKNGKTYPVPRYLIPMARMPGQSVRMHLQDLDLAPGERIILQIQPVDSAGNVGAVTSESFSVAGGVSFPRLMNDSRRRLSGPIPYPVLQGVLSLCWTFSTKSILLPET